jgi:hypothetical protein
MYIFFFVQGEWYNQEGLQKQMLFMRCVYESQVRYTYCTNQIVIILIILIILLPLQQTPLNFPLNMMS